MPQSKSAKSDGKVSHAKASPHAKAKLGKPLNPKGANKAAASKQAAKAKPALVSKSALGPKTSKKALPATGSKAVAKAKPLKGKPPVKVVALKTAKSAVKPAAKPNKTTVKKFTPAPIKKTSSSKATAIKPKKAPVSVASKPAPKGKTSVPQPAPKSTVKKAPSATGPVSAKVPAKVAAKVDLKKGSKTPPPAVNPASKLIPTTKRQKPLEPTDPWVIQQRDKIYQLRDGILESMHGVAKDTLRSRAEGSEASAFGMHQADAGSDAYDRDFALSLLSQEQDALYEIEEALKRIELGTYGICEMSGKAIMVARLEALPFARYTVECQAEVERQKKLHKARMPVTSLFGLTEEEAAESEEEDQSLDSKE